MNQLNLYNEMAVNHGIREQPEIEEIDDARLELAEGEQDDIKELAAF